MHELVEMEVRELLNEYKYDGDNVKFIKGSALACIEGTDDVLGGQAIDELVAAMDSEITPAMRDADKPFIMTIDNSLNIPGRGCVATGTIEEGTCKPGDDVTLIGIRRRPTPTQITGIESFKKTLDKGIPGDTVGILLKGLSKDDVKRGMCLVEPGKFSVNRTFRAEVYVLKEEEGGRHKPFFTGYRP